MKTKTVYRITLAFLLTLLALSVLTPPVLAQNNPPIADAGPDQTMYAGGITKLQGSAYDPDGDAIVAWLWTVESAPAGPPPFLSQNDSPDPLFSPEVAGEYVLSLIASDGPLWSIPDYVTIYALEFGPPVAIATANVTSGPAPLTVQFDGSQSYPLYGTELEYDWNFDDGTLSTDVSPTHVFLLASCTFVVTLTVFDSLSQSDRDYVTITTTVPEPPVPPVEDTDAYIEYVNETTQDLPDEIFNRPEEDISVVKNDFSVLLNDTMENINEDNYEGAIVKLNRIKVEIYEEMVESAEREEIISLIDELIAYVESLL